MIPIPTTDSETLVVSLTERVKTLEAELVVLSDLRQENGQLKERVQQAEASKDSLMRLVW